MEYDGVRWSTMGQRVLVPFKKQDSRFRIKNRISDTEIGKSKIEKGGSGESENGRVELVTPYRDGSTVADNVHICCTKVKTCINI